VSHLSAPKRTRRFVEDSFEFFDEVSIKSQPYRQRNMDVQLRKMRASSIDGGRLTDRRLNAKEPEVKGIS